MNGLFNDKVLTRKDIWPSEPVRQALNLNDGKTFMELYSFLLYLPGPQLVYNSPFLLIAGILKENFLPSMEHLMMAFTRHKKKTNVPDHRLITSMKLCMTTIFTT